jgi:hypothetical protein
MLVFLLFILPLADSVQANNVFVIAPSKEATQNVECNGCQSIRGNVSTVDGNIDFYISDPLGVISLSYENISFTDFIVNTTQNGTYVIHLVNRLAINNVTATLSYGRNFDVVLKWVEIATLTFTSSATTVLPISIPWIEPLVQIILIVFTAVICPVIANVLSDEIRRRLQKWRDGEPRTPSTVSP